MYSRTIPLPPTDVVSSLTIAAELFAQWKPGSEIVLNDHGITVNGAKWTPSTAKNPNRNTSTPPSRDCVYHIEGKICSITFDGKKVSLPVTVGLRYIRCLIQEPQCEMHVSDLVRNVYGEASGYISDERLLSEGLSVETDFNQQVVSPENIQKAEIALEERKNELEEFKIIGAPIEAVEQEIEQILDYLKKAGKGPHAAKFKCTSNSNRNSVCNAMTRAIIAIAKSPHHTLAEHLSESIKTGFNCVYKPKKTITWHL